MERGYLDYTARVEVRQRDGIKGTRGPIQFAINHLLSTRLLFTNEREFFGETSAS